MIAILPQIPGPPVEAALQSWTLLGPGLHKFPRCESLSHSGPPWPLLAFRRRGSLLHIVLVSIVPDTEMPEPPPAREAVPSTPSTPPAAAALADAASAQHSRNNESCLRSARRTPLSTPHRNVRQGSYSTRHSAPRLLPARRLPQPWHSGQPVCPASDSTSAPLPWNHILSPEMRWSPRDRNLHPTPVCPGARSASLRNAPAGELARSRRYRFPPETIHDGCDLPRRSGRCTPGNRNDREFPQP